MKVVGPVSAGSLAIAVLVSPAWGVEPGDPQRGAEAFQACIACHSVEQGRHLTGPSLADVWQREAGSAEGFLRYSDALLSSGITWDAENLDAFLADPQDVVAGTTMAIPGVDDPAMRADLIAFLASVAGEAPAEETPPSMPSEPQLEDLTAVAPERQVRDIRYCGDTYWITTAVDEEHALWEFNVRFKTDSSDLGPVRETPVLVSAGMMGDRVFVVFSEPAEMAAFIREACPPSAAPPSHDKGGP